MLSEVHRRSELETCQVRTRRAVDRDKFFPSHNEGESIYATGKALAAPLGKFENAAFIIPQYRPH